MEWQSTAIIVYFNVTDVIPTSNIVRPSNLLISDDNFSFSFISGTNNELEYDDVDLNYLLLF